MTLKRFEMMYEDVEGARARKRQRVRNWFRRQVRRRGIAPKDFIRRHRNNEWPAHGLSGK